jgi:hypothetical protein
MGWKKLFMGLAVFIGWSFLTGAALPEEVPAALPGPGTIIPAFSLPVPVTEAQRAYLQLDGGDDFEPGNLPADIILVEILSVYCASCQMQAPYMNALYNRIQQDQELRDRVKIIAIGAGNDRRDISYFEDHYLFPVFPDPRFAVHNLLGAPATPFLMLTRPDGYGRLFVADAHLGRITDADKLWAMVRDAYKKDTPKIRLAAKEKPLKKIPYAPVIPIPKDELMDKVRKSLSVNGEEPQSMQELCLPGLGTVYVGTIKSTDKHVFARLVARRIPCVDCHNVFFICSFDERGRFLDFVPIQITKRYNREFTPGDIGKIKRHFVGKSVKDRISFNARVDAVTSATISSEVIFDSMNKTVLVYQELARLGYVAH